jgi:histidinol-phosphatase (PHP family)
LTIADFHVHSDNSPDGENSVIELCENAVSMGTDIIAVTDHCEVNTFYKDSYDVGVRQSFVEVKKAISVFNNQIQVFMGLELGQATFDLKTANMITSSLPYDVILGSMHSLPNRNDFSFLSYNSIDADSLFSEYLEELFKLICWGGFDVLSHLTYPLRYMNGEQGLNLSPCDFTPLIEKVMREIIIRGIALEVNTSGLRQKYGKTMPDLYCLKLYKSLGGKLITLGSDAHRAEDIGKGIPEGIKLLKQAGFDKYCIYKKRKPEFILI